MEILNLNEPAARMRTITDAIAELKASDPRTALTPRALRRMVVSGEVPSIKIGCKYLLNLDLLFSKLNAGTSGRKERLT